MSSTCMQGGIPRPLGGYEQNLMMQRTSSPTPLWRYHPLVPKTEPIDYEDRNDSGINSSSPGSDNSENIPFSSPASDGLSRQIYANAIENQRHMYYARHSITPPSSKPMVSPRRQINNSPNAAIEQSLPYPSPTSMEDTTDFSQQQISPNTEDPLQKLQMALENNTLLNSQMSPKPSEISAEDEKEQRCENSMDDMDAQSLRVPKVNSHGKVKKFKCKHCDFVAITKLDFWEHSKIHIKADKLLTCPQCPFVTEFKHHLEYHLRNHFGSKPFKCPMCKYCCVNKSMLNSHLKSHSNIYQYRCSDCNYATKYCHSLKIHSRKYEHEPATVLDPDGTPNPVCVVDVYGKRRGPKLKTQAQKQTAGITPEPVLPFPINPMLFASPTMGLPFPGFLPPGLPTAITQALLQNLNLITKDQLSNLPPQENAEESAVPQSDTEALDLSKPEETVRNRRKGRAFKLTPTAESCSEDEDETTMFSNVEVVHDRDEQQTPTTEEVNAKPQEDASDNNNDSSKNFTCQYCSISFGDAVLYTIHMGQHGFKNPFCCNMCGVDCQNKIEFFLHIARHPHS